MPRLLLGVDAGTTAMKVALFDESGGMVGAASREYAVITPAPEMAELDAETYWRTLKDCLAEMLQLARIPPAEIVALAISSQGETFVPLGSDGRPVRRAIVWLDNRSVKEAAEIRERFGTERVYHVSGSPEVVPTWASTKMLWLKRNEPETFRRTSRFLFVEDYLIFRLTGKFVGETALYTSSLLMDIHSGRWWSEMLDFIGISSDVLPELKKPGEVVGPVTSRAATELGLSAKAVVVTGGMDQACGAIGAGNVAPGIATETTGTSLNICATTDSPVFDPKMRIPCQVHCAPGKYLLLPWCPTAGAALRWFRDEFCRAEKELAEKHNRDAYDIMTELAIPTPPGAGGLIMLPHLAGALCPESNPRAKGVFLGIGLDTRKGHLIRAIMESVAFMLRENMEVIAEMGIETDALISLGGAARSDLWNQIKADVTGKRIAVLDNPEAACLGAAILAGHAVGVFPSIEETARRIASTRRTYFPQPANREIYEQAYRKYRDMYRRVAPLF